MRISSSFCSAALLIGLLCTFSCAKQPDQNYYQEYWSTFYYIQAAIYDAQGYSKSIDPSAFVKLDQFLDTHKVYKNSVSWRLLNVLKARMHEEFGTFVSGFPVTNDEEMTSVPKERGLEIWTGTAEDFAVQEMDKFGVSLDLNAIKVQSIAEFREAVHPGQD